MAPLWLFVDSGGRKVAHRLDHGTGNGADRRGNLAAGRLVHEGHELIGEARHRTTDADAANVGASPHAAHPTTLGDVALDDRTPAPQFDETRWRVVFRSELTLLVVAGAIATLMNGVAEQPRRASGRLPQKIQNRLGQIVRLRGTAGDAHDRNARARLPIPAEIVENSHRARRIACHCMDSAVRRAGPGRKHGPRLWREAIDPSAERYRLVAARRVAKAGEIALF